MSECISVEQEFRAYWKLSDQMMAEASHEDLAQLALILAMQSAHYSRTYGELDLPDISHLMGATTIDANSAGLLRDGMKTLVGMLGMVTGVGGVDMDETLQ